MGAPPSPASATEELKQQFAATPRFSHSKSKDVSHPARSLSPPKPAVVQAFRASARATEDVEDYADPEDDDEMLDDEQAHALPTTEIDIPEQPDTLHWTNDLALSPKRRRLDDHESHSSITSSAFKQPVAPASHLERQTPYFVSTPAPSAAISAVGEQTHHGRPAFLRPSVAPQEQPSEPLPEVFSPHKRGQKFVPGGMAATVQQWVLETGQAAVQSRRGKGYLKGEDYVMRLKAEDVRGDGPFLVRGVEPSGETVEIMLAGKGNGSGPGGGSSAEISAGKIIGVRAPEWEVAMDGTTYHVAVDWRTL